MSVNPTKSVQKILTVPLDVAREIDEFRFARRFKAESAAIRTLICRGLEAIKQDEAMAAAKISPNAKDRLAA